MKQRPTPATQTSKAMQVYKIDTIDDLYFQTQDGYDTHGEILWDFLRPMEGQEQGEGGKWEVIGEDVNGTTLMTDSSVLYKGDIVEIGS